MEAWFALRDVHEDADDGLRGTGVVDDLVGEKNALGMKIIVDGPIVGFLLPFK